MAKIPREIDHRKPPLESRWTRNRRLAAHPGQPPEPPPTHDLEVIGNGNPSPNGDYFEDGVSGGKPCYRREDSAWWIWWGYGFVWLITDELEVDTRAQFQKVGEPVTGDYLPHMGAAGNPTVQLP